MSKLVWDPIKTDIDDNISKLIRDYVDGMHAQAQRAFDRHRSGDLSPLTQDEEAAVAFAAGCKFTTKLENVGSSFELKFTFDDVGITWTGKTFYVAQLAKHLPVIEE